MEQERNAWRLIRRDAVVRDPWLEVYEDDYELPDGSTIERYHALKERDGVMIVALSAEYELLMVRQWRPGIGASIYELPAGFLEDGETNAMERAQKELEEETGYRAEQWQSLGYIHDAPHRIKKTTYCFLALNIRKETKQHQDSTEFVRYESLALDRVRQMIADGEITSAVTIAALFKALPTLNSSHTG
jgi:8-oxo-dGTP pyrophosphatase MutT (NUDIX family)